MVEFEFLNYTFTEHYVPILLEYRLGVCLEDQSVSIVMELMSGGSLDKLLKKKKLTLEDKLLIIKGIAAGILHLHSEHLVSP